MMRLEFRTALTAAALAALLAAGCGSKPEPARPKPPAPAPAAAPAPSTKSEAPPLPAPPKPAEIAWGKAVDGLQVGVQVIGSREELRLRCMADLTKLLAAYTAADQKMPIVQALDRVLKDERSGALADTGQRLRGFLKGGFTFSEALQRSGLVTEQDLLDKVKAGETAGDLPGAMAGLTEALAGKVQPRGSFLEGEDIFTFVFLRNVSDRELTLSDSLWPCELLLSFARPDGWPVVRYRDPTDQMKQRDFKPLVLPAKCEVATVLAVGAEDRWGFEAERRPDGSFAGPTRLQPGRYTVNVGYEPRERKQPVPCWRGRISSGPVEIEFRPKSAAAPLSEAEIVARARAIGRQRWPEQTGNTSGPSTLFDERPAVTREGGNWRVVFQQGVLEVAGARATVRLDASGRELSTWCEWVPD